jgi:membrane-associated phospholipid phosphatase
MGLTVLSGVVRPAFLGAQTTTTASPHVPLFTRDDAYLGAFFILGTIALEPLDKRVAGALQRPDRQTNKVFQDLSRDVRVIAVPGSVIIGASLYAIGRVSHVDRMADLGLNGLEALAVGDLVTTGIKWTAGRARPYAVADTNPRDFQLLRGLHKGRDYSSFPSGHALAAFAAAAAVTNETSRWWPGSQWYIGPAMFGGAAAVGASRLYNNQHWLSDVVLGAGIGTFAGNKIVRYNHRTNPNNRLNRWLLSASIVPSGTTGHRLRFSLLPVPRNAPVP